MPKRALVLPAISSLGMLLLAFSCEPPRSLHPLSSPETAIADARLAGVWSGHAGDGEATLTLLPRGDARFDLVLLGNDDTKGAVLLAFEGFPTTLGKRSYWNLRAKSYGDDYAGTVKLSPDYIFARYELARDGTLTLWRLDGDAVAAALKAGSLEAGQTGQLDLVTSSSEKLAAFLATPDGQSSFVRFGVFHRTALKAPRAPQKR